MTVLPEVEVTCDANGQRMSCLDTEPVYGPNIAQARASAKAAGWHTGELPSDLDYCPKHPPGGKRS